MYTIKEFLAPVVDKYNDWLNGFYLSSLLRFQGQGEAGSDYISKVFRAKSYEITSEYDRAALATQSPSFSGFLYDNWFRIVALNGIERLVAATQAAPFLERGVRPNTASFLYTQIMNDGAFRGNLRGLSLNLIQCSLVMWPSVLITNLQKGGVLEFVALYAALDAIMHPIDTFKTRMYANTNTILKFNQAVKLQKAYVGVVPKAAFNIPFAAALYATATQQEWESLAWLATFLAYPLHSMKSSMQANSSLVKIGFTNRPMRGFLPFALVNYFWAHQLTALYSPEKLAGLNKHLREKAKRELGHVY